MNPLVSAEVGALSEGFSAFFTFVGFLTGVDSLMESKLLADSESLSTLPTPVGLFSAIFLVETNG